MNRAPRLRAVQEWMSHVVAHPATANVAVRTKAATATFPAREVQAGQVVKPNDRMSPTDRLQVYNGGYLARLIDVMAEDYKAVRHLLGPRRFHEVCAGYVQHHPSRHPNLNRFGKRFPEWLAGRADLPRRTFAVELARLERCVSLAFDAPEFTPLDPQRFASVPEKDWARARLTLNPSVHLLAFRFPTNGFYQQFLDEREPKPPRPAATWLCVYRKDDRVWRMKLDRPMHAVLGALARGTGLGAALSRAKGSADVTGWFGSWTADGLFADVRFR